MKIKAIRTRYKADYTGLFPHNKDDVEDVTLESFDACCDAAQEAFDERFIGFGEYEKSLNKIESMCIYKCNNYPDGVYWDEMPISSCPFCGASIQVEVSG